MRDTRMFPVPDRVSHQEGGTWLRYHFPNGYGASVISHKYSYGGSDGLWEIAVLRDDEITYDTPLTSDVLGYLTESDVLLYLDEIKGLPDA